MIWHISCAIQKDGEALTILLCSRCRQHLDGNAKCKAQDLAQGHRTQELTVLATVQSSLKPKKRRADIRWVHDTSRSRRLYSNDRQLEQLSFEIRKISNVIN